MNSTHRRYSRLTQIVREIELLQAEVNELESQGAEVEAINAALSKLGTDVDPLIAKGAGSISPAQAQTIADGLAALSAKVEAAVAA
jgi:prefoldin subunit 5